MKFGTKLIISLITIAATVVSSIWGAFEVLDIRMESKVKQGEERVLKIVEISQTGINDKILSLDNKTSVQLQAMNTQLIELHKDVRTLLVISKRSRRSDDVVSQSPTRPYDSTHN